MIIEATEILGILSLPYELGWLYGSYVIELRLRWWHRAALLLQLGHMDCPVHARDFLSFLKRVVDALVLLIVVLEGLTHGGGFNLTPLSFLHIVQAL